MPSRVCTHSGEWTPSVWARVTEVLFRVRVRVERISCGTYRVERIVSHFSFSHNMFSCQHASLARLLAWRGCWLELVCGRGQSATHAPATPLPSTPSAK